MTTPVSLYTNVLPQHVSLSAASVHRQSHTQTFVTPYQRQRYRCYSQTTLVDAVTAVRSHKMTARRASQIFKVPRSTIQMKLLKLAGKKTWGSHREKQQRSGGSLQDVSSETSELHELHDSLQND
ncbi:hypothetical protein LSAT2_026674 [Lamellibrachia satsuma]|nr:hypothetical protein LSAT2_026674 [Lamellibrachia satsuma]